MNMFEDNDQTPGAMLPASPPQSRDRGMEHEHAASPASPPPDASPRPQGAEADETGAAASLNERIIDALREVYDPEIPVNIYDLGLIYRIDCDAMGVVEIDMTLTAPGCPVAQTFPGVVEAAVQNVEGVATAEVELVWEPPWTPDRMSEATKLELGFF